MGFLPASLVRKYNAGLSFALLLFLLWRQESEYCIFVQFHYVLARQPYQAAMPGSLVRQPCSSCNFTMVLATLPGGFARQPCPAALPGSIARQHCPEALPGSIARQPCYVTSGPCVLDNKTANVFVQISKLPRSVDV
jgi:hypothetical protein